VNIFVRELKASLRSLVVWGVIVLLFVVVGITKFSAYYGNPELLGILDSMPPALLEAFSLRAFNLTTVAGFFGVMFSYYALLVSIAAAMWGSDVIAREERDKTVEFALTLPVSRARVVTGKALATLVDCIALLLITWGASLLSARRYGPDASFYRFLALCMLALLIMELIFWAIGILLGCAMRRYRRAGSAAVGLLLGSYFLSVISVLDKDLDFMRYVTPFRYFDASVLLRTSRLDPAFLALSAAIVIVSLALGYWTYARRDLYI
jgi:ABC-2 type transport system permease protein